MAKQESETSKSSISSQDENLENQMRPQQIKKLLAQRRKGECLTQFCKFLKYKLDDKRVSVQDTRESLKVRKTKDELLASEMVRRRLQENNSENRINRMMVDFEKVDTYVNVKQFVQEMNAVNQQMEHSRANQNQRSPQPLDEDKFYEHMGHTRILSQCNDYSRKVLDRIYQYIKPFCRNNVMEKMREIEPLFNQLEMKLASPERMMHNQLKSTAHSALAIQQSLPCQHRCSLQDNFYGFGRRFRYPPREARKPMGLFDRLQPAKIDDNYYQQFNSNLQMIGRRMNHTLHEMYKGKWKQNQLKKRKQKISKQNQNQIKEEDSKPIISQKYRHYASKNAFRFRPVRGISQEQRSKKNSTPERMARQSVFHKSCHNSCQNSIETTTTNTRNNSFNNKSPKKRKPRHKQPSRILVRDKYCFQKPIVKDTILRKVAHFIQETETKQQQFRRNCEDLNWLINKMQAQKRLDFDRFKDQTVQLNVDDLRKCLAFGRHTTH